NRTSTLYKGLPSSMTTPHAGTIGGGDLPQPTTATATATAAQRSQNARPISHVERIMSSPGSRPSIEGRHVPVVGDGPTLVVGDARQGGVGHEADRPVTHEEVGPADVAAAEVALAGVCADDRPGRVQRPARIAEMVAARVGVRPGPAAPVRQVGVG